MPLIKSASNSARETNIKEMIAAGHKPAQAVAASYHNQRQAERHTHEDRNKQRADHEEHRYGR